MARHGFGLLRVEAFLVVPQRRVVCPDCQSQYTGSKEKVTCPGCRRELVTEDLRCSKKVPTGYWMVSTERNGKTP